MGMENTTATVFGRRLAEVRRAKGIRQTALAKAGFTQGVISSYETGRALPSVERAAKLAKALGVPLDDLTQESQ